MHDEVIDIYGDVAAPAVPSEYFLASNEAAARLKERLKAHEAWLDGSGGQRLFAKNENLTGSDFRGARIGGAEFHDCVLDYSFFIRTDTTHNNGNFFLTFERCSFVHTNFQSSKMPKAVFRDCGFEEAVFKDAVLSDASISLKNSAAAKIHMNLVGADLRRARLANINENSGVSAFSDTVLDGAEFTNCRFPRFNFQSARNASLMEAKFTNCDVSNAIFGLCKVQKGTFRNCLLNGATFWNADFSGAMFDENCVMVEVNMSAGNFQAATLEQIDCGGNSFFIDADFKGASLRLSLFAGGDAGKFKGAKLTDADFSGANLSGVTLDPAQTIMHNANFQGAVWEDGNRCEPGSFGRCIQK